MVNITTEIKNYAKALDSVGDCTVSITSRFEGVRKQIPNTLEGIKEARDGFVRLLKELEMQEQILIKIDVPKVLREEHSRLFASYNKYVIATEHAISSLDVENVNADKKLLDESQKIQWEASDEIVQITNKIIEKLGI